MNINIKRIYEQAEKTDGYRILVDRLWPRGLKKEDAAIDKWQKEIAPSTDLRKWFNHEKEKFEKFSDLYKNELQDKKTVLESIKKIAGEKQVTLLYAAKDTKVNHAVVLKEYLENM